MRSLTGTTLYGTSIPNGTDGVALITGASQNDPTDIRQYVDHAARPQRRHPGEPSGAVGQRLPRGWPGQRRDLRPAGQRRHPGDGYVDGLVLTPYTHNLTAADAAADGPRRRPWPGRASAPGGPGRLHRHRQRQRDLRPGRHARRPPADRIGDDHTGDGDDYIEGNGGNDTIFGGFGQDDIVGDSSDLFGLGDEFVTIDGKTGTWRVTGISADGSVLTLAGPTLTASTGTLTIRIPATGGFITRKFIVAPVTGGITITIDPTTPVSLTQPRFDWAHLGFYVGAGTSHRPAGSDMIFGGDGTEIARNDVGNATLGTDGSIIVNADGPRPRLRRDRRRQRGHLPDRRHERLAVDAERVPELPLRQLRRRPPDRPARHPAARLHAGRPGVPTRHPRRSIAAGRRDPRRGGRRLHLRHGRQRRDLRRGPGRRHRSAATATTGSPAAPATTASSATTAASRRAATARPATPGTTRLPAGSTAAPATPPARASPSH